MHFHAEIWIPIKEDVDKQISGIMDPYWEERQVLKQTEEWIDDNNRKHIEIFWTNPNGFWDWFEIGGRWTGDHDGYNPRTDRRNWEKCSLCEGTGYRNDKLGKAERERDPTYTCNACGEYDHEKKQWSHGNLPAGMRVAWNYKRHDGDIMPVKEISDDLQCYTLILNGKDVYHRKEWNGKTFEKTAFDGMVKQKLDEMDITDGYMVTVDYHC